MRANFSDLGLAPVPEWEELRRATQTARASSVVTKFARTIPAMIPTSIATLLVAAWFGWGWLGLLGWTAGAAVELAATAGDTAAVRLLDLIGGRTQLRSLLRSLPAAALVGVVAGPQAAVAYLVVVLVVQLAWLAQPALSTWVWRSAPPLRFLPGARTQPAPLVAHARVYARGVGTPWVLVVAEFLTLAGFLLLSLQVAWWSAGIAALLALGYLGWSVGSARRLMSRRHEWARALVEELAASSPRFVVYVSLAARQSGYIVNQWLPALDALETDGLLLLREASQLAPLAATRHPVVYAPSNRDVEQLTLPSIKVAFYLAYGDRNATLLREPALRHVMLLHGDSDKATSANGMARAFDEIWVAGQAAVERYQSAGVRVDPDRFAIIGRPQAALLPVGPSGHERPILLYAPTFEGYYAQTAHSSLEVMGVDLVTRILLAHPQIQVWFRPHPASGVNRPGMLAAIRQISELLASTPGGHVVTSDNDLTLTECLSAADVLVCDVSSLASDYLFTERPIITCDPAGMSPTDFVATYPAHSATYLLRPGLAELDQVLTEALGPDPLRPARLAMKKRVLGDPPGGPQAAFAANLARLLN